MKEPSFEEELRSKVRGGLSPVPAPPKNLLRKKPPKFFAPALKRSLGMHGLILVAFLLSFLLDQFVFKEARDKAIKANLKNSKMAIRVDIVDLPGMKHEQLAKIDPTEEIAAKKTPEVAQPKPPPPSETAMKAPAKKEEKEAKNLFEKKPPITTDKNRLKEIQERLRADQKRQELIDKLRSKNENGREVLAGNKVSEGYSTTGDVATDSDVYVGKVKAHLQRHWNVPTWMNASKLNARIVVKLAADGRILSKEFVRRSGNEDFDASVDRALERANPFPAPPPTLRQAYMEDGIEWGFPN